MSMSSFDASGAITENSPIYPRMKLGQSALHYHEGQQRLATVAQCRSLLSGHPRSEFLEPTTLGSPRDDTAVSQPSRSLGYASELPFKPISCDVPQPVQQTTSSSSLGTSRMDCSQRGPTNSLDDPARQNSSTNNPQKLEH